MQTAHHSALAAKHAVLDRQIAAETQRPLPDATTIAALKKQKLLIKEELTQIQ
ncbi:MULTISPECIES: YdcH family protein [unclassified Sphingomonas]|uniref:YdcH family protein n=1 Tax=unclassified Sphingomonas TaxID=196159 RepID=UPI000287B077|nr:MULTISPECIES: YdcH family protein [unclassified Sphingomonas]